MRRVLSANLYRLLRSLWFWLCGGAALAYAAFQMSQVIRWTARNQVAPGLDLITSRVADFTAVLLILIAALCALFINGDYHDGTIRNKLIVGRTRAQVYLANYLTMLAAALLYAALFAAVTLGLGLLFMPSHWGGFQLVAEKLLLSLPYLCSVTAIFTLLSTVLTTRATPVLAIILALALLWLPQQLYEKLSQESVCPVPEGTFYPVKGEDGQLRMVFESDGVIYENLENVPTHPNPRYVAEPVRSVYIFFVEALPGGQAFLLSDSISPFSPPWVPALYAVGAAALALAAGVELFKRMDIR